ncbi:PspC domain-containing protein [Streptomyces sp. NBC_01465]|uniref:PspC domain-containing protein n=1 Tax=Streptomyces sp. NBC_01465 TaxID=2903878 RepID=UPI002E312DB4|nr:PspC domain-containing protein [Streptomyces sp. NBC_01465]
MTDQQAEAVAEAPAEDRPQLRRHRSNKVVAGVCGGLGRHFDLDPVIFRVVLGVLAVTGGVGLIFYGFAWLLVPLDGEDENEARRLLTGRVEGTSMMAVLFALVGCGLFLSMLSYVSVLVFAALLCLGVAGASVWSQRRRLADDETLDPLTAQTVADAPPETKAPPAPGGPSWWRDPIVKDGTTGPVGSGYLWGPADTPEDVAPASRRKSPRTASAAVRGPRGIGGRIFLNALIWGGLGTGLAWDHQPLGTALQIGFACALAVFGIGFVISAFAGRTGVGTIFLALVTAGLLAGASALPKDISTDWSPTEWKPASITSVEPKYRIGSGHGTLDLSTLTIPAGQSVTTRAEVGAGLMKVVVPKNATVHLTVDVALGDIRVPGENENDVNVSPGQHKTMTLSPPNGTTAGGTIELDLKVGVGQAEVARAAQ